MAKRQSPALPPAYFPKYVRERIQHWDDEREIGNSIIVTLYPGLTFSGAEHEGVRGFDTVHGARDEVKMAKPCSCADCEASPDNKRHLATRAG